MRESARTGALTPVQEFGWWIFVLLACAQFTIRCVWRGVSFLDLPRYAHGQEDLPFQGRVLMAWVLKYTAANPHVSPLLMRPAAHLPAEMQNPYSVVLLLVYFIAMIVAIGAGRATLEFLTGDAGFSAWGSLLLLYMSYFNLAVGYGIYVMPYDIVSLALFMFSVWLILTGRYLPLLAVFALATLNRETSIFITIFMALYVWLGRQRDRTRAVEGSYAEVGGAGVFLGLQVVIWVGVRLWIRRLFLHNALQPGMESQWFGLHLLPNLKSLLKPQQWPLLLSTFGFTLPLFLARFDSIGNRAFARATAVAIFLWTILMLFVGVIVEIRVFNELTAFLMPCVALIAWNLWIKPARMNRLQQEPAHDPLRPFSTAKF